MAVRIELNGGLGNQLFQYAFAKALQLHHKCDVCLDASKNYYKKSYRNLELANYSIKLRVLQENKKKLKVWQRILVSLIPIKKLRHEYRERFLQPKNLLIVNDRSPAIDFDMVNENQYIVGYFQKPKYFEHIRQILLDDFRLQTPLSSANQEMLGRIKKSNSVSLHVRRGDFLKHGSLIVLEKEYFDNAISLMQEKIGEDFTLFIFTEDIVWAKENIKVNQEIVFVDINDGNNVVFDLELMKNCKHNILSNSTLAWWGGYLNENENKVVIAPKIYLSNEQYNWDIHCDNWLKL